MAIDNIIQDSWQGHSHGEVEDALKAMLSQILQDIENGGIPEGGISADMLATALKNAINNAVPNTRKVNNKALSSDITIGAGDIPVEDMTLAQKLAALATSINSKISGIKTNDNQALTPDQNGVVTLPAGGGQGTVTGVKIGSTTYEPTNGVVELPESETGGLTEADIDVSSNMDGTVVFTFGERSYTINLNHTHPQYVVTDELDDYILPGTNVTITKDAQTGALTINASGGSGGGSTQVQANWNETDTTSAAYIQNKPTIPDVSGKADKSEMSVSASGDQTTIQLKSGTSATVINQHQSLTGRVQSTDVAQIVVLADEAAYTALATKDSNTLYLIPES